MIANRFSKRVTIIVGKDGKIAAIENKVNVRSAGEQLLKSLAKLRIEPAKEVDEEGDGEDADKDGVNERPSRKKRGDSSKKKA